MASLVHLLATGTVPALAAGRTPSADVVATVVFGDLVAIVVAARIMAALFRRLRQPTVVGEILAGLLLGPSFLGLFPGHLTRHLFPLYVQPYLAVLAQLGVVVFMFIVGLELNVGLVRGRMRSALGVALGSFLLPAGAGIALGAALYGGHGLVNGHRVSRPAFVLFIAVSLSVTAFPVLARIVTERGMHRTGMGAFVLACAAADDLFSWLALAVVIAVASAHGGGALPRILGETAGFAVGMLVLVRPALRRLVRWYERAGRLTPDLLAIVLVGLLLSSYATAKIGIHDIFGAFLFGAVMPREGSARLFRDILERLEQLSVLLLLPIFFIVTGLATNVRDLGASGAGLLGVVIVVATVGKVLGAGGAARLLGFRTRRAATVGVLMNTRGLTELIVLNIGFTLGVLDRSVFTILVLTAVVTTVATAPLLRLVYPPRFLARDLADAERSGLGPAAAYRAVAAVDDLGHGEALVDIAAGLTGGMPQRLLVLSRFRPTPSRGELGSGLTGELAAIADELPQTEALADRARRSGTAATVRAQFTSDPLADLVRLAATVDAAVLVLPAGMLPEDTEWAAQLRAVAGEAGCRVVAVALPGAGIPDRKARPSAAAGTGQILAVAQPTAAGSAVAEAAVHLALAGGEPLRLGSAALLAGPGARVGRTARWLRATCGRLAAVGVDATLADAQPADGEQPAPAVVVTSPDIVDRPATAIALADSYRAPVLVVHGRPGDEADDLAGLLRELAGREAVPATGGPVSAPATGVPSPAPLVVR
jgi:Kef-type K+ transport system membrane component KefB